MAAEGLGSDRPQAHLGVVHQRHAEPLGDRPHVDLTVLHRVGGQRDADVTAARALRLQGPPAPGFELVQRDAEALDQHGSILPHPAAARSAIAASAMS